MLPGTLPGAPPSNYPIGGQQVVSRRWAITTESVTVTVDGSMVKDPLDDAQLAVVITIQGFVAHSLAHALVNWSRCTELTGGERGEEARRHERRHTHRHCRHRLACWVGQRAANRPDG